MYSRKDSITVSKAWMSQDGDRQLKAIIRRKRESTGIRFLSTRFLSERFSGHGLPRTIGAYHNLRRFCWVILTLAFTGVMIWQCVKIIQDYRRYPKITNVEVNEVTRPAFPAVTICNQNSLNTKKIAKWYQEQIVDKGKNSSTNLLAKLLLMDQAIREAERRNMSCGVALEIMVCTMLGEDMCEWENKERKKRQIDEGSEDDNSTGRSTEEPAYSSTTEGNSPSTGNEGTFYSSSTEANNYSSISSDNTFISTEETNQGSSGYSSSSSSSSTDKNDYNSEDDSYYYEDSYQDYYGEELDHDEDYSRAYDSYDYPDFKDVETHDVFDLLLKSVTQDLSDFRSWITISNSQLSTFGYRLPEIVQSCTYNGKNCDLKKDFYLLTTAKYGNCFTFNSKLNKRAPVKYTSKYGSENGLKITLSSNADTYLNILSPEVGFRIAVHHPTVIPFPEDTGVDVPTNSKTSLAVTMSEFERLGDPYGNCSSNSWDYAGDYNIFGCRKMCLDEKIMKECGCKTMIVNLNKDQKKQKDADLCQITNSAEMDCRIRIQKEFNSGNVSQCAHCMASCRETLYNIDFSTSERNKEFQSARKMALAFRQKQDCINSGPQDVSSEEFLHEDLVDVHIYIKSKNVEKIIEKKAFTWETLISNLGGNVGLFLGLSLIAVMEIFEYLLDLILYFLRINRPAEEEEEEVMIEFTDEFGDLQFDLFADSFLDPPKKPSVIPFSPSAPLQSSPSAPMQSSPSAPMQSSPSAPMQSPSSAPMQPVLKNGVIWIPSISLDAIRHPKDLLGRLAKARYELKSDDE